MAGIFWGIFFTTFQVDFLYLNYIMPAFGMMLLCLQLRKFSEKNTFFRKAFRFSVLLLFCEILSFGISATPLAVNEMVSIGLALAGTALQVAMLLYLREALIEEYQKAEIEDGRNHWFIWLVVWKLSIYVLLFIDFGAVLSLIALVVILIGLFCYLCDTGKKLPIEEDLEEKGPQPLILWSAYTAAIVLVIIGGVFLSRIGFQELTPLEKTDYSSLTEKGMPVEIAETMSKEDVQTLNNVEHFKVLKPYMDEGSSDADIITVAGMGDDGLYAAVVWFSHGDRKRFSRDVLQLQGDSLGLYQGRVIYTNADGSRVYHKIDNTDLDFQYDEDFFESYCNTYLDIQPVNSAKNVSAYLLFSAGASDEYDEDDEEAAGIIDARISVGWYGLSFLQFPYRKTPDALSREAYSSYAKHFYQFSDTFKNAENPDQS